MYLDISGIFDSSRTHHVCVRVVQPIKVTENSKYRKKIFGRFVKGSLAAVYLDTASKIAGLL